MNLLGELRILEYDPFKLSHGDFGKFFCIDLFGFREENFFAFFNRGVEFFTCEQFSDLPPGQIFAYGQFVIPVLFQGCDFFILDFTNPIVLLDSSPGKDLCIDNDSFNPRGHPKGGIFNISGFLAENGAQQLFFRRELRFSLGGYFSDQYVAGIDLGAETDNTAVIQIF